MCGPSLPRRLDTGPAIRHHSPRRQECTIGSTGEELAAPVWRACRPQPDEKALVVHIDRVDVADMQPDVRVARVDLLMEDESISPLMRDGDYVVEL